jgi:hypothetical protein
MRKYIYCGLTCNPWCTFETTSSKFIHKTALLTKARARRAYFSHGNLKENLTHPIISIIDKYINKGLLICIQAHIYLSHQLFLAYDTLQFSHIYLSFVYLKCVGTLSRIVSTKF